MSLIKCKECGKDISDKATACPNCGFPLKSISLSTQPPQTAEKPAVSNVQKKHGCGCLFAILVIVGILVLIGSVIIAANVTTKNTTTNVKTTDSDSSLLTKEDAQDIDSQIWNYVYPVLTAHNNLMSMMSGYSDNTVSELDFYNATKEFEDYVQQVWGNSPSISDNNGEKYLESCRDYIIIEQTMAKSLLKYIDTKKTSDLSKVQEDIERCTQAIQVVASNRGTFLGINNFSDEEIQKIVEDTMQ